MRSARSADDRIASSQWSVCCGAPDIANSKAFSERIFWVNHVLREASNPRSAGECGYNRTIVANLSFAHEATCEDYPENIRQYLPSISLKGFKANCCWSTAGETTTCTTKARSC